MKRAIATAVCVGAVVWCGGTAKADFVGFYAPGSANLTGNHYPANSVLIQNNWRIYNDSFDPGQTDANATWFAKPSTPSLDDALQLGLFGNGNSSGADGTIFAVCTVDLPEDGKKIMTQYTGSVFLNNAIDKIWFVYDPNGLDLNGKMAAPQFYQLVPPSGGNDWTTPFVVHAGEAFGWAIYSNGDAQTGPSGTFNVFFVPEPGAIAMAGVTLLGVAGVAIRQLRRKSTV